jgi:hypothetical protein
MDATTDRKSHQGSSQSALVTRLRMVRESATGEIHSIDDKRSASLDAHQPGIESGASIKIIKMTNHTQTAMGEGNAPRVMSPIDVCDVKREKLSDGSEVWNVEFQNAIVGCRSEREAIFLNSQIKDLIANCSAWVET